MPAFASGVVISGAFKHDWIRFFPSGLVTSGCNLGVVNVYTRPVSDTTSNNTWVPVNVLNSYACVCKRRVEEYGDKRIELLDVFKVVTHEDE